MVPQTLVHSVRLAVDQIRVPDQVERDSVAFVNHAHCVDRGRERASLERFIHSCTAVGAIKAEVAVRGVIL